MTEQELIDEFEHEAWCDTQNNISKICNCMMGYPLEVIENLQETIAEIESRLEQSVDISVVNELNETIKAKDAEIERLLEQQAKDSYKERAGVFDDIIEKKDQAITEARELFAYAIVIFTQTIYTLDFLDDVKLWLKKAKAWLENNR